MGDDVNHKQMELNGIMNKIVGFPIGQFKDGFPLLLNNTEFWKINNMILIALNALIQSVGLVFCGKFIKKRITNG